MSQAKRLVEALAYLGSALEPEDSARIEELSQKEFSELTPLMVQSVLDPYCIAFVNINPEARVKVQRGPANGVLQENGWVTYLIKVDNESGTRAELKCDSPNAQPVLHALTSKPEPDPKNAISAGELAERFIEITIYRFPADGSKSFGREAGIPHNPAVYLAHGAVRGHPWIQCRAGDTGHWVPQRDPRVVYREPVGEVDLQRER